MMKTKLILIFTIAVGAALYFFSNSEKEIIAEFEPRITSQTEFRGAAEHRAKMIQNLETGQIEPTDRAQMLKAVQKHKKENAGAQKDLGIDLTWLPMGPNNFGGRTRDLCIAQDGVVYAGGVSSGLFRSWDFGNTWSKVPGYNFDMNVTTVEQAGNGIFLVGTGSDFDSSGGYGSSGFVGTGVYMSTDNGNTWAPVEDLSQDQFTTSGDFSYVDRILADHTNPDRVWIGCRGGLFRYNTVSGVIEDNFAGLPNFGSSVQDLKSSVDGTKIYCSISNQVYVSTDSGNNWTDVSGGDAGQIPSSGTTRVGLAVSPEDGNYAYALLSTGGRMGGVYATNNGGTSWQNIWPANDAANTNIEIDPFGSNRQGDYDLCISVFPNDKEKVVVGGVTMWQGGWNIQPQQIALNFAFGSSYVHSDLHHFEWDASNDKLYICTDGGIFTTNDITLVDSPNYIESNFGYMTTQFYGFGIGSDGRAIGGTQDNGTFVVNSENMSALAVFGGDGFDSEMSKVSSNAMFATSQNGPLGRSFDGGNSFNGFYTEEIASLAEQDAFPFYMVCRLHENTDNPESQQTMTFVANQELIPAGETVTFLTNNLNQSIEYVLDEPLEIRDSLEVIQEVITEVEDSLITLMLQFDSTAYAQPEFMWDTLFNVGITEIGMNLPEDDIIIEEDLSGDPALVTVQVEEDVEVSNLVEITLYDVPDTLTITDPYTSLFAIYCNEGVFVTRHSLDANALVKWENVLPGSVNADCIEFSLDGDHMFVGTTQGNIWRVSGFNDYWVAGEDIDNLTATRIFNTSGPVLGISVDPNDPDRIACAVGGYGGAQKVWITDIATTAEDSNNTENFDNIWFTSGDFTGMPCYDVLIVDNDANGDDIILVATEFGIWGTDDIGNNNSWVSCSSNIDGVPVFDIKQQYRGPEQFIEPTNTGEIYIATHGKGIWRTGGAVSVEELATTVKESTSSLKMFPNPAADLVNLEFNLNAGERLNVEIYNVTGTLLLSKNLGHVSSGNQVVTLDVSSLPSGNYIVHAHGEETNTVGKLLVD